MKVNALRKIQPYNSTDVLHLEGMGEARIAHVVTCGVMNLRFLQVEARLREPVKVSDMVVMQMRKNDVADLLGINLEKLQRVDRAAKKCSFSFRRHFGGEAAIDNECPLAGNGNPEKIIHRHRTVVRVTADEIVSPLRIAHRIANREQLIFWQSVGHDIPLLSCESLRDLIPAGRVRPPKFYLLHPQRYISALPARATRRTLS